MTEPFLDLAAYTALPRVTGLAVSPDGARVVVTVQQPDEDGAKYVGALWEVAAGEPPRRLTHSTAGESAPVFGPDGALLFVSSRDDEDEQNALWALPATGEASVVLRRPGGVSNPRVAARAGSVLLGGSRLAFSTDADDEQRRRTRKDRKISAILHTGMPVRYWDHDLDDTSARLLLLGTDGAVRDLAPHATSELSETAASIDADGRTVATGWRTRTRGGDAPSSVALIDTASGEHRVLAAHGDGVEYGEPVISPDGALVALAAERAGSFERPPERWLEVRRRDDGSVTRADLEDVTPGQWVWSPDSRTLHVTGDRHGRGAVVAVDAPSGAGTIVVDDAVYTDLHALPDGTGLVALRSGMDSAPAPVLVSIGSGTITELPTPAPTPPLPGRVLETSVPAADGEPVHAYVFLPGRPDPAPVMLWIHGGPFGSYNTWSWRWNPWVAVAHGWAVVLPDPALSTGYGQRWLERAWPYVAAEVFADCVAVLDDVLARSDTDETRLACLGASFGGYMTNWVAGHTADRFGAIVTHAGLWSLDQEHATTDAAYYKTSVFGRPGAHPEWYAANSPDQGHLAGVPMLLTHGSRDFRVPISEALRLWWELVSTWDGDPADLPHRFLQLTGENHWVLSPANAQVWYDAVLGFCAEHVLDRPWTPSPLL